MKCPQGHTNPKTARFCGDCGAKLVTSELIKFIVAFLVVAIAIVTSYLFGSSSVWCFVFLLALVCAGGLSVYLFPDGSQK